MSVRAKWAVVIVVALLIVSAAIFQKPLRVHWHKWRFQSFKEQRDRSMRGRPSVLDKIWLHVTGRPTSAADLEKKLRRHEDALVTVGFLRRERFDVGEGASSAQISKALADLKTECPWYRTQTISGTNVVVTACPGMFEDWRKRTSGLGWKSRGNN